MNIADLILTSEEYSLVKFEVPYTFEIKNAYQELVYIGASHKTDPADKEFSIIEEKWNTFISDKKTDECIAVIESGLMETKFDKEKSIINYSESGLLVYLAQVKKVRIKCFEPTRGSTLSLLVGKYSREELFYHYMAQNILQWNRRIDKPDFQSYMMPYLSTIQHDTNWKDFDFSLSNLEKIHTQLFNNPLDVNDREFFNRIINPHKIDTVINKIGKDNNLRREVLIVQGILEQWRDKMNIFIVYGSGHAIVQERALKALLK